ncbi:MAG TPA: hypothetical protein VFI27_15150 [candidate division Zixibacteria bacterium]|nr:hypothetical protein [candidate division Zixibacteria bacterium]
MNSKTRWKLELSEKTSEKLAGQVGQSAAKNPEYYNGDLEERCVS